MVWGERYNRDRSLVTPPLQMRYIPDSSKLLTFHRGTIGTRPSMTTSAQPTWPTESERSLLRESFIHLIPHVEKVSEEFYDKLFNLHPSVKPLFKGDIQTQREKLVRMLASAVDALQDREGFVEACRALGSRHVAYGAVPAHYPIVGSLLLETIKERADPPITEEELGAWENLYRLIAEEMLRDIS
jgi:hemoglobin-like flavoprotein